ncbi:hypothetical protein [Bradyrhizobium sp. 33ap4]|uniref:hypothetical protein n=1 Tax=Bradyrhizobium sp. 33ap4 TaxID=3061630 RepID=UPI0029302FC0|nr:hypothetical protein [Bradyrhizobium sp. 33ap4]
MSIDRTQPERKRGAAGIHYNGIDRENAFKGYTFENSRTCCDRCNSAKMQMSSPQYLAHCLKVVSHSVLTRRSVFD